MNSSDILVSIIVPTYKEADNIAPLISQIDGTMKKSNYTYQVIIVDDDSNDGIADVIEKLKRDYNVLLEIRKGERGLSSAVIRGFNLSNGSVIVVMDADLSHPPDKLSEMLNPIIQGNSEFVLGSRFIQGGSAEHFNLYRRFNAWVSKMLARPLTKVSDPMAGFFAFPKRILNNKESTLNPLGFKIGLELIVKLNPLNIKEIPISFQKRLHGESKLNLKEQIYYILHLKRLYEYRYNTLSEFIKFSIIGSSGMIVDLTSVYLAYGIFRIPYRIARALGFIFALTSNFLLNRLYTFQNTSQKNIYKQYISFLIICLLGFSFNWTISVYLFEHFSFFQSHYLISAFIGILGGLIVNFSGSKFLVFR
jgi:dolichol-phosphate mannosyltransferase